MNRSDNKYNPVTRAKPFPDVQLVAKVSGKLVTVAVMPSGDRYVVLDDGWRRLRPGRPSE